MKTRFSTDGIPVEERFRFCQERNIELFGRCELRQLPGGPFTSRSLQANVGPITLNSVDTSPVENAILARHRDGTRHAEHLNFNILRSGEMCNRQLGISGVLRPGDICMADNRYDRACRYPSGSEFLAVTLPRHRVERLLGPSRHYIGLVVDGVLPGAALVTSFFNNLLHVHQGLGPEMSERMAGIGIDLITASIAERMAMETPKALQGTVLVQRAKAHVEANLGDPALNPARLAAAMAVSLRRLQLLFDERGQHISDWIWTRRLETAAQRLADPGCVHLSIGTVANDCGFASQAHFSRRFRDRFGMTPRECREAARPA